MRYTCSVKKKALKPVILPVLVESENPKKHDGWWGFHRHRGERTSAVRIVSPREIVRKQREILRGPERRLYLGLQGMVRAFRDEKRDGFNLEDAFNLLRPSIPSIPDTTDRIDWSGPKIWGGAAWEYSTVMSTVLRNVRPIVWYRADARTPFSPGLLCPDLRTAAFALHFTGDVRICPKCERLFVPKREDHVFHESACRTGYFLGRKAARARRKSA
jgi:hypothetical protein